MKFEVRIYDRVKYDPESKEVCRVIQEEVDKLEVGQIFDKDIYAMGFDEIDEYGEYAILTFMDGSTATYRNSHIDIFRA